MKEGYGMIKEIRNKKDLYKHFLKDVFQFTYHIGDLDDFWWADDRQKPYTRRPDPTVFKE